MEDGPDSEVANGYDDSSNLGRYERLIAGLLGLIGVGVGGFGIFLSDNQAGTTAILLLGSVFLLMAVQGTAIIKAGKDSIELQRKREGRRITRKAVEAVEQKNDPEVAGELVEAARRIDPTLSIDPGFQFLMGQIYERNVFDAIIRAASRLDAERRPSFELSAHIGVGAGDDRPSAVLRFDEESSLLVEVRYIRPASQSSVMAALTDQLINRLSSERKCGLIVTNISVTSAIVERALVKSDNRVDIVQWENAGDDDQLQETLRRLLR